MTQSLGLLLGLESTITPVDFGTDRGSPVTYGVQEIKLHGYA